MELLESMLVCMHVDTHLGVIITGAADAGAWVRQRSLPVRRCCAQQVAASRGRANQLCPSRHPSALEAGAQEPAFPFDPRFDEATTRPKPHAEQPTNHNANPGREEEVADPRSLGSVDTAQPVAPSMQRQPNSRLLAQCRLGPRPGQVSQPSRR
ncbi:uncharacterized protein CC84DRAFT_518680 [Paraphaeosphaeria sporulosa]|uniref:Uncharacterized protein n=1 Tax=Paraphaeosphaeria sporulosa TaxID=1460663 RepID=A0A177CVM6_9PLEO|nr:uncharacterized protein CC84DRAFT_518680 [Paraphaeosphaeria sporulosa]OAG11078.1 hypothetical protein CC84DRAFT_518680 [Paraphaeosphaeria sporulosa]